MHPMRRVVLLLLAAVLISGCTVTFYAVRRPYTYPYRHAVVVSASPPEVRDEDPGPAPGASYVWVPGYWTWKNGWVWRGGRWVARIESDAEWQRGYWEYRDGVWFWVEGRWVARTYTAAVWVPGHWERRPRGWVWIPGHWR